MLRILWFVISPFPLYLCKIQLHFIFLLWWRRSWYYFIIIVWLSGGYQCIVCSWCICFIGNALDIWMLTTYLERPRVSVVFILMKMLWSVICRVFWGILGWWVFVVIFVRICSFNLVTTEFWVWIDIYVRSYFDYLF